MTVSFNDFLKTNNGHGALSSDLFSRLRKDILNGKFYKGYKLTEQQICSQYKVSRTPVREAIIQLEMEGLVETIPNRGAFVLGLSNRDIEDMHTLRQIYEVQATKWAIERITEEELDALEETFEFMEFYTMKKDMEKMLNINNNFHRIIYYSSHNRMLIKLLSSYQVFVMYNRKKQANQVEYLEEILEEHRKIFEAFKNKDTEAGGEAMCLHLENSKKRHQL